MKQPVFRINVIVLFAVLGLLFSTMSYGKIDPKVFSQIKPRSIGPANMSGRIGDIDVVLSNPNIIYVGTATGGVWKSLDGGLKWAPIFDDQPASSIGAVKIFQANPSIVWVGTGEANPRNSVGVGRGVFKSIDGGKTWINLGLEKTEKISRIILDANNPDIAYAAAMGTTWGENPERGVYKTVDGGKNWEKILYVDQKTGAADLAVAPDNPNRMLAAMWEHRRWPWFFNSGGSGSGLYLTTDGGKTWKKLTDKEGMPKGDLGRIGVAFSASRPNVVYAMVEAKKNVLLRSSDGGDTWTVVNNEDGVNGRPFYYCDIRVNPKNENILYKLESQLHVSEDAGKNFRQLTGWGQAHADFQAMWLHPNGEHFIVGTDGGIVITQDRGKSWRYARNLPIGQFYHVSYDMELPYNVYGGLQDNGSWRGPGWLLTDYAIYNYHWLSVGGGDGFDTEPDPEKPWCGYGMSQGGNLFYFNTKTGRSKYIRPAETDVKHRYNWNAALAIDPHTPSTIYYGSQFVHRSKDKGFTWEIISPDLTTNDPEKQKQAESGGLTLDVTNAENHTTLMCIAPSPVKKGVIWTASDDGYIHVTQDDGKTWNLVSQSLTGVKGQKSKKIKVPFGTNAPHIEASKFNPACAFVVFEDHQRSNWTPYVFMTEDYGKTWKSLATKDIDGFVRVIEQDHVDKNLLFIGTEFGLYFSANRGQEWHKWTSGFPTVPVHDIQVHPRENDLIIGTHGRSIYILDDISFLRGIDQALVPGKKVHLFDVPDSTEFIRGRVGSYSTRGDTEFMGPNRPTAAAITFFYTPIKEDKKEGEGPGSEMRERMMRRRAAMGGSGGGRPGMMGMMRGKKKPSKFKIEILDKDGNVIRELERLTPKEGINRVYWDFRGKSMDLSALSGGSGGRRGFRMGGPMVYPGTYTVRMTYLKEKFEKSFKVTTDPRFKIDVDVWKENNKQAQQMNTWIKALLKATKELKDTGNMIKTVTGMAQEQDLKKPVKMKLMKQAKELGDKLKALGEKLQPTPKKQGIADRSASLRMKMFRLSRNLTDQFEPLSQATKVSLEKTKKIIEGFIKEYNEVFTTDVGAFKKAVKESGLTLFKPFKPLSLTEDKKENKKKDEKKKDK